MARKRETGQGGLFIETKLVNGERVPKSQNWVGQYYDANGKQIRKSTGTAVKSEAQAILDAWVTDSRRGLKPAPETQGLTYDIIRDDYIAYAVEQELKSLSTKADGSRYFFQQTALDEFFAGKSVNKITRDTLSAFIAARKAAGNANKTINGSLSLLRTIFQNARDNEKLNAIPKFDLLPWKSRQGFLPPEAFQKLFDAIPARFQPLLVLLYTTGVRIGEADKIQWSALNLEEGHITLLEGETKNDEARVLPLVPVLVKLLSAVPTDKRTGKVFASKFALQHVWEDTCATAKVEGLLIHDLRRSAVRNMMKSGAQQAEAMKISGHKDASVFQRYNIIDSTQTKGVMAQVAKLVPVKIQRALPAGR
jgi:integrase